MNETILRPAAIVSPVAESSTWGCCFGGSVNYRASPLGQDRGRAAPVLLLGAFAGEVLSPLLHDLGPGVEEV